MAADFQPTLRQWLVSEGGAVPFRRFMEAALYDPKFGYYTRQIRSVGAQGDFSTSATLSPRLGQAIAHWITHEAAGGCRHLIEIGPGSGALHQAVRQALGWRGRWHWKSHLVERSPRLEAEQRKILGRGVQWHPDPASALQAAGGEAIIFSNELVDAFPVTLLQRNGGIWQEVWLELTPEGRAVETVRLGILRDLSLSAADFAEGQRIEVHESWGEWFQTWRPHWRRGTMLTIDYGGTADGLYHRRPQGTLRGYHQHRLLDGLALYRDPGHCDLTADVNFTDLIRLGESSGLLTVKLESQSEFLTRHSQSDHPVSRRLADPHGAGGAFQCLQQRLV